jgi:hypothetical protein
VFDDKIQSVQLGTIAENKRLGAALALVKEQPTTWPATSAPGTPRGNGHRTIWTHRECRRRAGCRAARPTWRWPDRPGEPG